jgi:homoserine O-succinyltransferase
MAVCFARPECFQRKASPLEFRDSDASCLDVGIINNMPDAALEATERQFFDLLHRAAGGLVVRLTLYSLPGICRSDWGRRHVASCYSGIDDLWGSHLDGLIVTGTEPLAPSLADEPYWQSLTRVLEWADRNAHSSVWSCLAAHAAVLHIDGIARLRLGDKRFGVFDCARLSSDELIAGLPSQLQMPHSRWNDLPEKVLTSCGYRVLTRSEAAGVDSFVKQTRSLLLFFQGHPEYESQTLLLEYRRDVGRYLRGDRDSYPPMPQGYFHGDIIEDFAGLQERATLDRREDHLMNFPTARAVDQVVNTWRSAAVRLYRNWLMYLRVEKSKRLRVTSRWNQSQNVTSVLNGRL